ncbi:MAG: hypothetical protein HOG49_28645 [Candidatus Scalindua sp.]|jgi:hypothetical protein|nr:hypothetical protein [Candidatus Scalindua sp.]
MNWYKIAQQMQFDFWNEENRDQYLDKRPESMLPTPELGDMSIEETVEDARNLQELMNILNQMFDNYDKMTFPNGENIIIANSNGELYIIEIDDNYYELKNPEEWLNDKIFAGVVYQYIDEKDFSKEFWDDVSEGYSLYHGTYEDRIDDIQREGIGARDETRGMSNKSTGSAVFTSSSPETAYYSYERVFKIDVGAMKRDGYMPGVAMEEDVGEAQQAEALANKIGLEDYSYEIEQGMDPETVIFHGSIPTKYLELLE